MATYQFNPNGALDTAAELAHVTTQLERSLADLKVTVEKFITANAGNAPDNYTQAQTLWNNGQYRMNASLIVGQQKLEEIHHEYLLGDNKGANVFGSLI